MNHERAERAGQAPEGAGAQGRTPDEAKAALAALEAALDLKYGVGQWDWSDATPEEQRRLYALNDAAQGDA